MAKLYFNYSSMNAGKTTVLLQSAHNYRERGMLPLLFTPKLDDRYGTGWIKSRIGLQARATIFTAEDDLFEATRAQLEERNIHCVLVDEAQFLSRDQVYQTGRKATMVVRVDDDGYALKEGAQVEIGGNERYVSVSRAEFKKVFIGGQRIKFIEPVESEVAGQIDSGDEEEGDRLL
jgi:thymidine kinase